MSKYDAVEFELPVGAIIRDGDVEMRHLGNGRFITPLVSGKMACLIELSCATSTEGDDSAIPSRRFGHKNMVRGNLTQDALNKCAETFRRIRFMVWFDPEKPEQELNEPEMITAAEITQLEWQTGNIRSTKSGMQ
jgi:hypothetical protein